jgi:hypothetical protein
MSKRISLYDRKYIDENYMYEPIARMQNVLNIMYRDIEKYFRDIGYIPAHNVKAKPKIKTKSDIFDVDNYKTFTI